MCVCVCVRLKTIAQLNWKKAGAETLLTDWITESAVRQNAKIYNLNSLLSSLDLYCIVWLADKQSGWLLADSFKA